MAKQGITEGGLRVGVKGGGCSGLSYTFAWEKQPRLGDEVFEGRTARRSSSTRRASCFSTARARLRHEPDDPGLRVQQPERQVDLRLRQLVRRVTRSRLPRQAAAIELSRFQSAPSMLECRNCGARRSGRRALLPAVHADPVARPPRRLLRVPRSAAQAEPRRRAISSSAFATLSRQFHPGLLLQRDAGRAPREPRALVVPERRVPRRCGTRSSRVEYLLQLEGLRGRRTGGGRRRQVPPALLEEVFALNEELDEIRELRAGGAPADVWKARLERRAAADRGQARRARSASCEELAARWDAPAKRRRRTRRDARRAARAVARAELHQQPARGDRAGTDSTTAWPCVSSVLIP